MTVNVGLCLGSAHVSLPLLSCPHPNLPSRWLRPGLCPWSSQSGCGLGTGGLRVAAASQAFPTGAWSSTQDPQVEAGEQSAQCPGSKDAAACHWSHFLPRPRSPCSSPLSQKGSGIPGCSQWLGCRLTTHLRSGSTGGLFLDAAGPLHPGLLSQPPGLAVTRHVREPDDKTETAGIAILRHSRGVHGG